MPMDPDAQRLMDLVALAGRPAFNLQSAAEARNAYNSSRRALQLAPPEVAEVRDLTVGDVPARLYRGHGAVAGRGLLYMHGGGWVLGNLDSHDGLCRSLANQARCRVVAVDYRLAPEHPFPAALLDCAAVFAHLVAKAAEFGIDPALLAVGGDSAGGNLAALLALRGRNGAGARPCSQVLLYPVTDLTCRHPSVDLFPAGVPLTGPVMRWFRDQYMAAGDPADPLASPLHAALHDLPPAFVLTVGYDPLRDEGIAYAKALEAAGCAVTHLHMATQVHGFLSMNRVIRAADTALCMAAAALRHGWGAA